MTIRVNRRFKSAITKAKSYQNLFLQWQRRHFKVNIESNQISYVWMHLPLHCTWGRRMFLGFPTEFYTSLIDLPTPLPLNNSGKVAGQVRGEASFCSGLRQEAEEGIRVRVTRPTYWLCGAVDALIWRDQHSLRSQRHDDCIINGKNLLPSATVHGPLLFMGGSLRLL